MGYYDKKFELTDAIKLELGHLDPEQLKNVLKYCRQLASKQEPLFDSGKKCVMCPRRINKPRRGPMPRFCSNKCRQKAWREGRAGDQT